MFQVVRFFLVFLLSGFCFPGLLQTAVAGNSLSQCCEDDDAEPELVTHEEAYLYMDSHERALYQNLSNSMDLTIEKIIDKLNLQAEARAELSFVRGLVPHQLTDQHLLRAAGSRGLSGCPFATNLDMLKRELRDTFFSEELVVLEDMLDADLLRAERKVLISAGHLLREVFFELGTGKKGLLIQKLEKISVPTDLRAKELASLGQRPLPVFDLLSDLVIAQYPVLKEKTEKIKRKIRKRSLEMLLRLNLLVFGEEDYRRQLVLQDDDTVQRLREIIFRSTCICLARKPSAVQ